MVENWLKTPMFETKTNALHVEPQPPNIYLRETELSLLSRIGETNPKKKDNFFLFSQCLFLLLTWWKDSKTLI